MNPILIKFLVRLFVFTTLVFVIHLLILNALEFPLFNNEIVFSYGINTASAIIIFLMLFVLDHILPEHDFQTDLHYKH